MNGELRRLRLETKTPAKEMVKVVKDIYPKYDKSMQSKCERGDEYGIQIRGDALKALYATFAPEMLEESESPKKPSGGHRLKCRISCRLPDEVYADLVEYVRADGYTMQDWIAEAVHNYIQLKRSEEGRVGQ